MMEWCDMIQTTTKCSQKRRERCYCVYGVKDSWHEGDDNDADTWEQWALKDDLYQQIAEYYEQKPQLNICLLYTSDAADE